MRLSIGILFAAALAACTTLSYAKNEEVQACVEGLRIAAKNEYNVQSDKELDTLFSDAFCDVVKDKRESKSKTDVSGAYGPISAAMSNDQAQLAEYDRSYCRSTLDKLKLKTAYRLQASIVTGDPLTKFNTCMKTVTQSQAAKKRGVYGSAERTDACRWSVNISYVPSGKGNPSTARVDTVHAYNVSCTKSPTTLNANDHKMECRRTSWGPGALSIGTSQESLELEFDPEQQPSAPTPPTIPATDNLTKQFQVTRGAYDPSVGCVNDGRNCTGKLDVGSPAAKITNVVWTCAGSTSSGGHSMCGFMFGNKGAPDYTSQYAAQWVDLGRGVAQWSRYWDGDASNATTETYTVSYTAPHVDTPAETAQRAAYSAAMEKYNAAIANGPCPVAAPATKKVAIQ